MSSGTENYERLNELLTRLVYPTCEKILDNHLRANKVSIYQFLETNKHRIVHCFRVKSPCCSLHANCTYPIKATLTQRQWSFLYKDEEKNVCTKPVCICNVVTTCKKFRNLNLNVICFLIIEFSMLNGLNMEALKRLNVFNQEMQDIRTGIVPYSEFQTKWNTTTDSLMVLGVTQQQIDRIKKIRVNRTPTPTAIDDRGCRCPCCKILLMALVVLIILAIPVGIIVVLVLYI
ncbi:uncharacterized protein LOC134726547 [Mytilus trossulus]|uniref:uncharacterized protein LOC134726547 n=1 Tax=Mytilus trossulus TaxID=6551 RepID=UPI003003B632